MLGRIAVQVVMEKPLSGLGQRTWPILTLTTSGQSDISISIHGAPVFVTHMTQTKIILMDQKVRITIVRTFYSSIILA